MQRKKKFHQLIRLDECSWMMTWKLQLVLKIYLKYLTLILTSWDEFEISKRKSVVDGADLMSLKYHECHDGKERMILA